MEVDTVNPQDAWNIAFNQLELQLDRASFDTWLRGATFLAFEEGVFIIGVRNSYAREMLQHRLYRNVWRVLSDVFGSGVELRFEVCKPEPVFQSQGADVPPLFRLLAQQNSDTPPIPLHQQIARPQRPSLPDSELNPRFTFERFLANVGNTMTYEASLAVSERPGIYNPFLVYGGVGLGKTHLLHAIAHVLQAKGQNVTYISSEAFTNDLVDAIRHRTTAMFRDKYRSVDVLLVDDIQFIGGKESTQEEFFHTFNALHTFNKQIVLASDRHPSMLTTLEDRLRSRFEGGLVVDIQPPEYETRVAIVEMWASERDISVSSEICEMIAERAQNNVRELEGLFNQVVANARLGEKPVTTFNAEVALNQSQRARRITVMQVIEATAKVYGVSAAELIGKQRARRVNQARQVAMYLAREYTDDPLTQIGDMLGGRSHTTVLHGCSKVAEEVEFDDTLFDQVERIRHLLDES